MPITRENPDQSSFNPDIVLPYQLRREDFALVMQDVDDFRKNPRGELGTRTATLDRYGIAKLRKNWVYLDK
ncbi:MAG: hypothetical protein OXI66_11760 [Boseongicola sp.]|nr:hypothetical protein [Boseongicola sp.]